MGRVGIAHFKTSENFILCSCKRKANLSLGELVRQASLKKNLGKQISATNFERTEISLVFDKANIRLVINPLTMKILNLK